MQNNYVRELAIKSYQEEITKEYYRAKDKTFHTPSFMVGILLTSIVLGVY